MFGFINLNKPQGFTSHDCVAKIRRTLNTKKVGHGGTLDPEATGVLPIAVGKATKLLQFLPERKAYRARIRLGMQTTTDDLEGDVIAVKEVNNLNKEEIIGCLKHFQGHIEQVPPMYSAIKRQGQKLYELARKGIEVEVPPRNVTIYSCKLIEIIPESFPEIEVAIVCGTGTYIRAIARDLGIMLGVGGTLANLIRTESCSLELEDSLDFATIEQQLQNQTFQLIKPDLLLLGLKAVVLDKVQSERWCHGQTIGLPSDWGLALQNTNLEKPVYLRVYQEQTFLGIGVLNNHENTWFVKPKIVSAEFNQK